MSLRYILIAFGKGEGKFKFKSKVDKAMEETGRFLVKGGKF